MTYNEINQLAKLDDLNIEKLTNNKETTRAFFILKLAESYSKSCTLILEQLTGLKFKEKGDLYDYFNEYIEDTPELMLAHLDEQFKSLRK